MNEQLSVNLSLDIVYVYGTVNGEVANFSLTSPGVWSAVVPKSVDGRYEVSIQTYNSLGTMTQYDTVIYKLDDLIPLKTDWLPGDYYNADDLNRVEADTQYIASVAEQLGYAVVLEDVVTDRDQRSIEFAASLSRVERNIAAIANGFLAPPGYQQPRTWTSLMVFDYRDATRLERNLQLLHDWLVKVADSFRYCGTFACGEDGGIY